MNRLWRPMALKALLILQVAGTVVVLGFALTSPEQGLPGTLVIISTLLCGAGLLVVARRIGSEPNHELVVEHASDLIMVLDTTSDGCVYASPSYRTVLGYAPSTLVGQSATLLMHPADIGLAQERQLSVRPDSIAQATIRFQHADGTWRWVETRWSTVRNRSTESIVMVGRDVTELQQLETRLAQLQQLDRIGRMATGIVHDVNNLLSGISGCAELVSFALPLSSPAQRDLEEIKRSAAGAADLTKQLLTSTRNQRNTFQLLNLNDLILGIEHLLRRLSGDGIDLTLVQAEDLGLVNADPRQIERVLVNLVINARDAMPEGGQVHIATSNVRLGDHDLRQSARTPGAFVRLSVSDTGSGIDAGSIDRIFERFYTTKEPGKGNGIGLASCHAIVQQHGGHLNVFSTPGRGTTFTIDLPCCPPSARTTLFATHVQSCELQDCLDCSHDVVSAG